VFTILFILISKCFIQVVNNIFEMLEKTFEVLY